MQVYAVSPCRLPAGRRSGKIDMCAVCVKRDRASSDPRDQFTAMVGVDVAGSFNRAFISATSVSSMSSP